jgi:hypothetical protein
MDHTSLCENHVFPGVDDVGSACEQRNSATEASDAYNAVQVVVLDHYFLDDISECLLLDDAQPHTVIRVFGSLRNGLRACVHIHGVNSCNCSSSSSSSSYCKYIVVIAMSVIL